MNEITISKEQVADVYQHASAETKEALRTLFGGENNFRRRPTLDDYTTIRSYEDACEALGEKPILDLYMIKNGGPILKTPPHIIALMKLETISRALWGRTWRPQPDAAGERNHYSPAFVLFTESDIDGMNKEQRRGLLSACVNSGESAGFGCQYMVCCLSNSTMPYGLRLCQGTKEKARYFGQQFAELWAKYLKFDFEVGGRLK